MNERPVPSGWRGAGMIAAVYGAWLVTCVLSVGVLILWHSALQRLYITLRLSKWGMAFYNNTVVLVLALGWLVVVIVLEGWLRRAADEGGLGRRFGRVLVGIALLGLAGYLLGELG